MARIVDSNLEITKDRELEIVTAKVFVRVDFDDYEKSQMPLGLRFRLDTFLFGQDSYGYPGSSIWGDDDQLYRFDSLTITAPDQNEFRMEKAFRQGGTLDEDRGKDDIYAKFRLVNLYTKVEVLGFSNLVDWGHF